jgi:hypothetical protein
VNTRRGTGNAAPASWVRKRDSPEKRLRNGIRELLRYHRYEVVINWQGQFSERGVSDLLAIRRGDGHAIWIECKGPHAKVYPEQVAFLDRMRRQGCTTIMAWSIDDVIRELGLPGLFPAASIGRNQKTF